MSKWVEKKGDKEVGPGSLEQMKSAFKKGSLALDSLVREEGSDQWIPLKESGILGPEDYNPFMPGGTEANAPQPRMASPSSSPIHADMFREHPVYTNNPNAEVATFVERFIAILIDSALLWVLQMAVMRFGTVGMLLGFAVGVAYFVVLQHEWGFTIGRKIMKIQLETTQGLKPDMKTLAIRYVASIFSGFILLIGYFICLLDPRMKTLHDKVAGTQVVKS